MLVRTANLLRVKPSSLAGTPKTNRQVIHLQQTRFFFPMIFLLGEEAIPKRAGYTGSRPTTGAIHANTTITAVYTKDGGIVIPPQPTTPGEIMSGGEGEPVEADVPAEDETVSPQGTHVTGTQTVTHEYLTLNGKVARETIRTNNTLTAVLDFVYDESGKPFALKYSTDGATFDTYYYVLNLQGDVVKLIQANGHVVAHYTYDAWGNVSSSGRLAEINPLRYRGYYYDNETGFYYLQSRYYDPANRRFINADTYSSTDPGDAIGCNMFAYCGNNPVMRNDYSGDAWWHWVVATVAVVGLAVASVVTCGGAAAAAMTATALISGTCTTVPAAATIITGAALGAGVAYAGSVVSAASSVKSTEEFAEYGKSALISTVAGAVVGAVAGAINAATSCFVAGTPVLTEDGDKPIEDVTVGDYVWAWDEATGTTELKQVVETYVNETSELTHIFVNGEEIVATPTHPFYCPVKGWTDAAHLRAGDILVLVNGEYVVVEKIQHELLENPVKVYNFQVQDYHTYYVAESGVLVHNRCLPENSVAMSTDDALDTASDYLGPNYTEVENGRYVSFDGDLQVRIGNADILGQHAGGPHINLDWIGAGKYRTFHIFLLD